MQRYEETVGIIRHNGDGKRRYETMLYPKIPKKTSDIYILSKKLERMDNLAYEYYGDPRYWWVIRRVNKLPGGTLQIPAGRRIRIPFPLDPAQLEELMATMQF